MNGIDKNIRNNLVNVINLVKVFIVKICFLKIKGIVI